MTFIPLALSASMLFLLTGGSFAQDRLPPIPAGQMTAAQKKAVDELISGKRGALTGPFIPLLRSPEFMSRLQKMGEYLRFESSLEPKLSEFVILLTARQWSQQYEWNTHYPLALKAGVSTELLAAVAEGRRPAGMSEEHEVIYDFVAELHQNRSVSDATYQRAVKKFGEQRVIDIIGVSGYYTMLGMILNVARTPLPAGDTHRLPALPN